MSFERVFLRQRFRAERDYLVDWCWIALLAVVFLPWPVHGVFPVLAVIFGSGLAVRFGGYPTRTRSWEYLLTRSISRERLVRALFLAMALPILAFCLFGAVADALRLREWVFSLFVPMPEFGPWSFSIPIHLLGAATALLLGAHVFYLAILESREDVLGNVRVNGLITGVLLYGIVVPIAASLLSLGSALAVDLEKGLRREIVSLLGSVPGFLVILAAIALNVRFAITEVRRKELSSGEVGTRKSGSPGLVVIVVVILVILALGLFFFLPARVSPVGT
jgi:hypothetical protein